ncbi:hypothetical protein [Pedobacter sp.]|uniref:hypothetical protein n=1 Tax=Pedobacter sp. TaxID=1411316 RepID=UPI003BAC8BA6
MLKQFLRRPLRLCIPLALLFSFQLRAQTVITEKTKTKTVTGNVVVTGTSPEIEVDLGLNAFSNILPFDTPFKIKLSLSDKTFVTREQVINVNAYYNKITLATKPDKAFIDKIKLEQAKNTEGKNYMWRKAEGTRAGADDAFHFSIGKLPPNRDFTFIFEFERKLTLEEKKKLQEITQQKLRPLMKSSNGTFEFSVEKVNSIVIQIKEALSEYLAKYNLATQYANEADNLRISESVELLSSNYEGELLAKNQLEKTAVLLEEYLETLDRFTTQYKMYGKDGQKANNLISLGKLLAMSASLLETPLSKPSFLAADISKQQTANTAYLKELDNIKIAGNKEFETIKANIKDGIEALAHHTKAFVDQGLQAGNATVAKAATIADVIVQSIFDYTIVAGTSFNSDFVTRANTYISADLGLALIPSAGKMVPYLGTNIYFRPVNRNEKVTWSTNMAKRVSLLVGLSVGSIAKPNYRADLLANSMNLVTGVGFRVASFVRFNGGYVWFTKINDNPLNTNNSIAGKPFVSLSFDIDVRTVFSGLFSADQVKILKP